MEKILIFKRVIRRFVGKILNYFGIKFLILKLFEKKIVYVGSIKDWNSKLVMEKL